jgi:peptide/nickel transport system substrate-binding protein
MVLRGSSGRFVIGALVLAALVVPFAEAGATAPLVTANSAKTLSLSIPGPFNGCSFLDPGATPSTDAVNDLLLPSAFLTSSAGNLYGENGPIASAELTSLSPETVKYTLAPNEKWSNGNTFNGNDLVGWWLRARALKSVQSDGYRDITTLTVAANGLGVTAVFATPYAEWNLLFRDVEELGTQPGCTLADWAQRPTLGPYVLSSVTKDRIVLKMNTRWPIDKNRFGRIVITDSNSVPASAHFADFSLIVNRAEVQNISAHPNVQSHIGSSSEIEELAFAATRPFTARIAVREALSWSIARQTLIDQLWGAVTFSPSAGASALFSQGQAQYPGPTGSPPTSQTTTTTIAPSGAHNGLADCFSCASDVLSAAGFTRTARGWATSTGKDLALTLAVGPSELDQSVVTSVVAGWASMGIKVRVVHESSEIAAAVATATNTVDLSIFTRPTITTVSYTARSWSGPGYDDAYPSGWRSTAVTKLFNQAVANFNPVTAISTWLMMDQQIQKNYWLRPLFTPPSLQAWSTSLVGVTTTFSVPGLVDQLPAWTIAAPSNQG